MTAEELGKEGTSYVKWGRCVCVCTRNCLKRRDIYIHNAYTHIHI